MYLVNTGLDLAYDLGFETNDPVRHCPTRIGPVLHASEPL